MFAESIVIGTVERAHILCSLEDEAKVLKEEEKYESINTRVFNGYLNFERLCFSMSQADGKMSPFDFEKLNAYQFMRHKKLLEEHLNKKRP